MNEKALLHVRRGCHLQAELFPSLLLLFALLDPAVKVTAWLHLNQRCSPVLRVSRGAFNVSPT